MSIFATLRSVAAGAGSGQPCRPCAHFCNDPARLERELPGMTALCSAAASVRAEDGLCLRHGLITNGRRRCPAFTSVDPAASAMVTVPGSTRLKQQDPAAYSEYSYI